MNNSRFSPFLGVVIIATVIAGAISVWFEKRVARLSSEWRDAAEALSKPLSRNSHVEPPPVGEVWALARRALNDAAQATLDNCDSDMFVSFGSFEADAGTLTQECRSEIAHATTPVLSVLAASRAAKLDVTPVLLNEALAGQVENVAPVASVMLRLAVEAGDVGRGSDICLDTLALARDIASSDAFEGQLRALHMTQAVFRGCWALIDQSNTTYKTRFIDRLDTIDGSAPFLSQLTKQEIARREFFAFPKAIRAPDLASVSSPLWASLVPTAASLGASNKEGPFLSASDWETVHTALTTLRHALESAPEQAIEAGRGADTALKPVAARLMLQPGYFEQAIAAAEDRASLLRMLRRAARADLMHLQTNHWPPETANAGTDVVLSVGQNDQAAITSTNPRLSATVILLTPDVEPTPPPVPQPKNKKAGKQ